MQLFIEIGILSLSLKYNMYQKKTRSEEIHKLQKNSNNGWLDMYYYHSPII